MCVHSTAYLWLRPPVSFTTHHLPTPPIPLKIFSTNHLAMLHARCRCPHQSSPHTNTTKCIIMWRPAPLLLDSYPIWVCTLTSNNRKRTSDQIRGVEWCVEHHPEAPDRNTNNMDISSDDGGRNDAYIGVNVPWLGCLSLRQRWEIAQ